MQASGPADELQKKNDTRTGAAALATSVGGTSVASLLYRLSYATGLSPLWVNLLRMFITLVIMTPMTLLSRAKRAHLRQMNKKEFWISALSGTILAFHFTCWAFALANTSVFAAMAISGTTLLLNALFSSLFLKERTSRAALGAMVVAVAGVVVCNLGGTLGTLSGNLYALLAGILSALYSICGRKARRTLDVNTYTSVAYLFTFFWMGVLTWVLRVKPDGFEMQNILWALGLAIFATLLGHTMMSVALKYFKAPTVNAVSLITMIIAPLIVYAVLGEIPSRNTFLGGGIIIVGIALYLRMEWRDTQITRTTQKTA